MEFDFIVVGAGSAGCVMAERLSADGTYSVALIEAGGTDRRFFVQMPLGYGRTFYDDRVMWTYRAEPDAGLAGQADYWPRGKVLGGSSSVNAMVWIRGAAEDFDGWAAEGAQGWSYQDCLPYFKAIEDNHAGENSWRGVGGPVHITDVADQMHPLAQVFVKAARQFGFSYNPDFNGARQEGIGPYQITTKGGWRMSAAKAFLRPAMRRRNLTVFTEALVLRVMITEARATGVLVVRAGRQLSLAARREVIVCAGAVNSPQLLQISGIGDPAHLASLGVPLVRACSAVGQNLQDHLGINYTYRARVRSQNEALRSIWGKALAGVDLLARGRGPLSLSLNQAGGFVRTRANLSRPNIQLYFQALTTLKARTGARPLLNPDPFPGFSLGLSTCHPTSRGSIRAASSDSNVAPVIKPNAFATAEDRRDMLEGVKLLRQLASQPALASVIDAELVPGPAVQSDDDLIADFSLRSGTVYHPVGTCKMGADPNSCVVDTRLRTHGLKGLRIADASVFPKIISGNTNAPTMMVAAKGASAILEDNR